MNLFVKSLVEYGIFMRKKEISVNFNCKSLLNVKTRYTMMFSFFSCTCRLVPIPPSLRTTLLCLALCWNDSRLSSRVNQGAKKLNTK